MFLTKTTRVFATIALVTTLQACGKSKDGHDPAPIPPSVEITGQSNEGDEARVSFTSAQENAQYECRVDRGEQTGIWTECNDRTFAFKTDAEVDVKFHVRAKNGELVSEVQSIVIPKTGSNTDAQTFKVTINEKNNVSSVDLGNGNYQITFYAQGTNSANLQYMCKVGSKDYAPCTSPFSFSVNSDGTVPNVSVYAVDQTSQAQSIEDVIYLNENSQNDGSYANVVIADDVRVQLGDFYEIQIPTTGNGRSTQFYISEQATSKTDNTELDVYRIMPGYDQRYIGNTLCAMEGFQPVKALTPSGKKVLYCNGTPAGDTFKFLTNYRWARNHLELITEPEVTNRTGERTIAMFNAFDGERDLMQQRTRFDRECLNSVSGIQYVGLAKVFDDFMGRPVFAAIYTCQSQRSMRDVQGADGVLGPSLGGKRDEWTVSAAFIIRSSEAYLPRHQADCRPVPRGVIPCWDQIMPRANHILEVLVKSNQSGSTFISTGNARRLIERMVVPIR